MSTPTRLLQITHDLAIGGLQQVVLTLCRTIDRERFHVTVLCLRALGPLAEEIEKLGIKVILLPQKRGTDYFSFLKVAKILREEKIQVVHTHNTQPLIDGTIGAILSGGKQRIIHTDHAREFPDKKRYMFAEWCMSHFVYKMVGVSEQTTENLRKYEKIPRKKLTTIANGIDGSRFDLKIDRQEKRKELGITAFGPVIGVISRLEKVKGITYLLQAMPEIIKTFPELTLLIVGDGAEMTNLQLEVKQLGVGTHVIFIGERYDIPEIYQILDIYLLPSLSEGLPMGLLEAMASGCPVIASRVGGIPKVAGDNETAVLVEPQDADMLANKIVSLLGDNKEQQRLIQAGREVFGNQFSAELMSSRYLELYKNEKLYKDQ